VVYEKEAILSRKAVISLKHGKIERKLITIDCLYKVIHDVSTGAKM